MAAVFTSGCVDHSLAHQNSGRRTKQHCKLQMHHSLTIDDPRSRTYRASELQLRGRIDLTKRPAADSTHSDLHPHPAVRSYPSQGSPSSCLLGPVHRHTRCQTGRSYIGSLPCSTFKGYCGPRTCRDGIDTQPSTAGEETRQLGQFDFLIATGSPKALLEGSGLPDLVYITLVRSRRRWLQAWQFRACLSIPLSCMFS